MSMFEKLKRAEPNSSVVYHSGPDLKGVPRPILHLVRNLYDQGKADLVQRRTDRGFEYVCAFRAQPANIEQFYTFRFAGLVQ